MTRNKRPIGQYDDTQKPLPSCDEAVVHALRSLIDSGYEPNFIFSGDSVLHVAALNALLLKMEASGIFMCGVILNTIPPNRIPQFDADDLFSLAEVQYRYLQNNVDCQCEKYELTKKISAALSNPARHAARNQMVSQQEENSQNRLYLIWPAHSLPNADLWNIAYSTGKVIECILIEEGTGSYLSRESALRLASSKKSTKLLSSLSWVKGFISSGLERRRKRLLRQAAYFSRFGMFDIAPDGGLLPNNDFATWMRKSLELQAASRNEKLVDKRDFSSTLLFIATNFSELGPMSLELAVIKKVAQAALKCGLKICIRPHPRTADISCYERLGVEIDRSSKIAFEAVLASASTLPLATIGFCSSSQVLANVLWDIPAFSVAGLLEDVSIQNGQNTKVMKSYISRVRQFEKRFGEHITQVGDMAEFEQGLLDLIDENPQKWHACSLPSSEFGEDIAI